MKITAKPAIADPIIEKSTTSGSNPFRSKLERPKVSIEPRLGEKVHDYVQNVLQDEKKVERALKRAHRGAQMSNVELLETQALLYRYTQEVDLASKVVDKTANGFKQLMNIQV